MQGLKKQKLLFPGRNWRRAQSLCWLTRSLFLQRYCWLP